MNSATGAKTAQDAESNEKKKRRPIGFDDLHPDQQATLLTPLLSFGRNRLGQMDSDFVSTIWKGQTAIIVGVPLKISIAPDNRPGIQAVLKHRKADLRVSLSDVRERVVALSASF